MIDAKICDWLMENADAPIRYRVARELLGDEGAAKKLEPELLANPVVQVWLKNLKPETPPQHRSMEHGSFDFCLENALLKAVQLGLHAGLPQVADAVGYYVNEMAAGRGWDIVIANLLSLVGIENKMIADFMLNRLDTMYRFVQRGDYDIYYTEGETSKLRAIPKIWRDRKFIRREFSHEEGYRYPFIYDIVGLHTFYRLNNPEITRKIDAVMEYISTDEFHHTIEDGYGILIAGDKRYHSQGWDPKYPGWFDPAGYMENINAPKLLFFAQYIVNYPLARETKWFGDLLGYLEKYRTERGAYVFPVKWFAESQGYAVQGHHLSFGENRRKRNWCEIDSTFYMLLLTKNAESPGAS